MNKEIELQPDAVLDLHRHNAAHVILFLSGCVQESDIAGRSTYSAGDILFRPPFSLHANLSANGAATYIRCPISWERFLHLLAKFGWQSMRGKIPQPDFDLINLAENPDAGDVLSEYLTEPVYPTAPNDEGQDEMEALAIELRRSPQNSIQLNQYAMQLSVEPFELTRRFKRRYGISPCKFRNEVKMQSALNLLVAHSQSLKMVAVDCGYADQSHLSREISKATSFSPAQLRRTVLKGRYCNFVQY